jgi:hypothetical protein
MSVVHWDEVAQELSMNCPSPTYRAAASRLLTKAGALGPLISENRSAADEFSRVYRFLHYNEAGRLDEVLNELLKRLQRQGAKRPALSNAWNYVVGAFDQWMMRARVFYLTAGLLEGTLRSRLNATLTDAFGTNWPSNADVVPRIIVEKIDEQTAVQSLEAVRRFLDEPKDGDHDNDWRVTLRKIINLKSVSINETGEKFVLGLTFGQMRSFFQAKKLWSTGPTLSRIFIDPATGSSPLRNQVDDALAVVQKARNDVAHYRPNGNLNFSGALYECAKLTRWLGVDLQHFYGSVDTRASTELSVLLAHSREKSRQSGNHAHCRATECKNGEPLDLMLTRAPMSEEDVATDTEARSACAYHRVILRIRQHRPVETG